MTIPSISGNNFVGWGGFLVLQGPKRTRFEQGGVPGYGYLFGALKTGEQQITTTYRASGESDAFTTGAAYRNLITDFVTVVDPLDTSWDNVLVLDAQFIVMEDPLGYMTDCTWTLLPKSE